MIAKHLVGPTLQPGKEDEIAKAPPFLLFMPIGNISGIYTTIPTFVRGMDAWVLPEPGEEPVQIKLPQSLPDQQDGRRLSLDLELGYEGNVSGSGRDEHLGFEAASLKDALERLDRDQRKQAVESMLGRGLHGVTLDTLTTEHESDLGGSAALLYTFHAPFARKDGKAKAVVSGVNLKDKVAVSIEPDGGSKQPTTTPIVGLTVT